MSDICIRGLEMSGSQNEILPIRHPAIHNQECCIWRHRKVPSCNCAGGYAQIRHWSLVALPCLLPRLWNFAWTLFQKHLHRLPVNAFTFVKIIHRQPVLNCLHSICNSHLPTQRPILNLFHTVLPPDNGPILVLQIPSHPYFLPLVKCTNVGLAHPFGKLLQGEFHLFQADWHFAFCTTQVRRIFDPIICIIIAFGHIRQWR